MFLAIRIDFTTALRFSGVFLRTVGNFFFSDRPLALVRLLREPTRVAFVYPRTCHRPRLKSMQISKINAVPLYDNRQKYNTMIAER